MKALYRAATPPAAGPTPTAGWDRMLGLLADLTGAESAFLRAQADGATDPHLAVGIGPAPDLSDRDLAALRADRIYGQADFLTDWDPGHPLRLIRVNAPNRGRVWLGIARGTRDFRAVDGARLADLGPHLGPAVAIWGEVQADRAAATRSHDLAASLGAGWLTLDRGGRVSGLGPGMARRIAAMPDLHLSADGRLSFAQGDTARRYRAALDRLWAGQTDRAFVPLSDALRTQVLLLPEGAGHIRLVLRQDLRAAARRPEDLRASLGLSKSETRLAILLCDGASLSEAAGTLGWTVETARSTSKQIYARTGAGGQADLIRMMLNGVVWCVPPE